MHSLWRIITRAVPDQFRPPWRRCYSQEGEDMVLVSLFGDDFKGIYVDIGAHDPVKWSNTKKLAERGWRGLNIDPLPGSAAKFRRKRPYDISLQAAVDIGSNQELRYWMFDREPRWNCLSPVEPVAQKDGIPVRASSSIVVPIVRIDDAVREARLQRVDLINIDVEGGEDYILRCWPWDHFPPKVICVEVIGKPAAEIAASDLTRFLREKGMVFTSRLINSVIYVERNFLRTCYPSDPHGTHFNRALHGR